MFWGVSISSPRTVNKVEKPVSAMLNSMLVTLVWKGAVNDINI